VALLDDPDGVVRLEAAYFLHLLDDPRSEPKIRAASDETRLQRLSRMAPRLATAFWIVGPFLDEGSGFRTIHSPEIGPLDLSARYGEGNAAWTQVSGARGECNFGRKSQAGVASYYAWWRLESPRSAQAVLEIDSDHPLKVLQNGREVSVKEAMLQAGS